MKKHSIIILLILTTILPMPAAAEEADTVQAVFTPDCTYTGEVLGNLSGGIKTGARYLGYATLGATFNTEAAKWWKGGSFRINIGNTHGGTPTENLIGDSQTVSNIEAGNHSFLSELWFNQQLGKLSFTFGLQDMNADCATCPYACNYINSSFGIFSTLSTNFASPIFPITGLGLDVHYEFSDNFMMQSALFDGDVLDFEKNPHNLKWHLNEGLIWITEELLTTHTHNGLEGQYKLGWYYHTKQKSLGFYGTLGQTFWKQNARSVQAFVQVSYTQKNKKNNNYLYLGGGVNMNGVFSCAGNDWLGIGIASAFFDDKAAEATIELSYKYNFGEHFFIQPDVQYVIHPAGTEEHVRNALAGILRVGFEF